MLLAKVAVTQTAAIRIVLRMTGQLWVKATVGASARRAMTRAPLVIGAKRATSTDLTKGIRRCPLMLMAAGPITMTSRQGRMNRMTGIMILTGTWAAFSSARWRRLTRISVDWTRSTWPIGMPKASACTMALTKERMSASLVRSPRARMASDAAAADLHLLEDALELAGQRPVGVAGHLLQGGVEAEPGLDRDGHQVDGIGQGLLQLGARACVAML